MNLICREEGKNLRKRGYSSEKLIMINFSVFRYHDTEKCNQTFSHLFPLLIRSKNVTEHFLNSLSLLSKISKKVIGVFY